MPYSPELLNSKVVILATIRDCEDTVEGDIEKLRSGFALFKDLSFCLIESDSTDGTVQKLEKLKQKIPKFNYLCLGKFNIIYI